MEKLPGVAVAYPDSHVKGIKIRYRDKEATAIGLAMPREAALVNMADEILVAGRFFDEGNQPRGHPGHRRLPRAWASRLPRRPSGPRSPSRPPF